MDAKQYIAKRTAKFFKDNDLVNLGIGMPTMCMAYNEARTPQIVIKSADR